MTVIGDNVNMAARIESSTKGFQAPMLISEAVHHHLRNRVQTGKVFDSLLKGKSGTYKLYEVSRLHAHTKIIDPEKELRTRLTRALNEVVTQQKAPLFLRAAFHDAGKYDGKTKTGGADGTLRLAGEISRATRIAAWTCRSIYCVRSKSDSTISPGPT